MDSYTKYYTEQAGSGISVYRGTSFQRGNGVGSFLAGLFRSALPLIKSGARALGFEALKTGANVLDDIAQNKNTKEAFKHRLNEAGQNLKRKASDKLDRMVGAGYKRARFHRHPHSRPRVRETKTSKKKRAALKKKKSLKSKNVDIFG